MKLLVLLLVLNNGTKPCMLWLKWAINYNEIITFIQKDKYKL